MADPLDPLTTQTARGVGVVNTQSIALDLPAGGFVLANGHGLAAIEVAYETYGELSPERDNVKTTGTTAMGRLL